MRVVVDTNVLVSALLVPNSRPADVLKQFRDEKWSLAISGTLIEEYGRVLRRKKFGLPLHDVDSLLQTIEARSIRVIPSKHFDLIADDPADNELIDVAVESKANFIVSGDSHLLSLGNFHGVSIVSPAEFLRRSR